MRLSALLTSAVLLCHATLAQAATLDVVPSPQRGGVVDGAVVPLSGIEMGAIQESGVAFLRRILREQAATGVLLIVAPQILEQDETLHVARAMLALAQAATGEDEAARANLSQAEAAELAIPEMDLTRALLARNGGDLDQARSFTARALAADPEHSYAHHIRATLALAEGDTAGALQDFFRATELAPEAAIYWSNLGVTFLNADAPNEAATALARAADLEPGQCPTLVGLALLRAQQGAAEAAVARLNACLEADRNYAPAARLLISTQIGMGDVAGARRSYGRVQRVLEDAWLWDATLSLREGRYGRVAEVLDTAPSQEGAQAHVLRGMAALALGEFEGAGRAFETALDVETPPLSARVGLVALDLAQGATPRFDSATDGADPSIDAFYAALSVPEGRLPLLVQADEVLPGVRFEGLTARDTDRALPPEHIQALAKAMALMLVEAPHAARDLLAGLDYDLPYPALSGFLQAYAGARAGDGLEARMTLLDRVTAQAPGFHAAQVMMAEGFLQQNLTSRALRAYRAAAETRETGFVLVRIGLLGEALGDEAVAEDGYRRFAALEPENYVALNQLAWFLASRGRALDEAKALATQADALQPGNASILDTLGWIAFQEGDFPQALSHLREANRISAGQNAEIRFHLAQAEKAAGNRIEALLHFEALDAHDGPPLPFASQVKQALAQLKQ